MKNLVISTHKTADEFRAFTTEDIILYKINGGERNILVIKNPDDEDDLSEINKILNDIDGHTIFLSHGGVSNLTFKFNCHFQVGNYAKSEDRQCYNTLLNAKEKMNVFDEVWNYFQSKVSQRELYALKTSFLDDNIYTNTCPNALPSELSTPELVVLFEPIKGKAFNRNDQSYMVHFEKFKSRLNELYQDI